VVISSTYVVGAASEELTGTAQLAVAQVAVKPGEFHAPVTGKGLVVVKLCLTISPTSQGGPPMPNQPFEVASQFDDADVAENMIEAVVEDGQDSQSLEINLRRAQAEHAENLRLARAL
jgi:hypothetical protein